MNKLIIILVVLSFLGCAEGEKPLKNEILESPKNQTITTDSYELIIPDKQEGLLILFPCMPCDTENTKSAFDIVDIAHKKNIVLLLMNFNEHLWLTNEEKQELEAIILDAVTVNNIKTNNTFLGGFSSGGNVSLLLSDYLKSTGSSIQPKGVFIVDSPLDLLALYESAQKTIEKDFSQLAVNEALWIMDMFDSKFGSGEKSLKNYEASSPYISKSNCIQNLSHLENVKIRLYSEPDTTWWRENRHTEYEAMNAYYIEQLAEDLTDIYGLGPIEYIKTKNKGYRADGERHPHSWSIVDPEELLKWMGVD